MASVSIKEKIINGSETLLAFKKKKKLIHRFIKFLSIDIWRAHTQEKGQI